MPQVQLNEEIFNAARQRANEAGYTSVEEYVSSLIAEESQGLDRFFTPERLALIDHAAAQVRAGDFHTAEQSAEQLAKQRAEWVRNHTR